MPMEQTYLTSFKCLLDLMRDQKSYVSPSRWWGVGLQLKTEKPQSFYHPPPTEQMDRQVLQEGLFQAIYYFQKQRIIHDTIFILSIDDVPTASLSFSLGPRASTHNAPTNATSSSLTHSIQNTTDADDPKSSKIQVVRDESTENTADQGGTSFNKSMSHSSSLFTIYPEVHLTYINDRQLDPGDFYVIIAAACRNVFKIAGGRVGDQQIRVPDNSLVLTYRQMESSRIFCLYQLLDIVESILLEAPSEEKRCRSLIATYLAAPWKGTRIGEVEIRPVQRSGVKAL